MSQVDTWDPKGNTGFQPISTNAPGIQISEILPKLARHMDKLSIIRSMKTEERNHAQGTIETLTGHRPNPAMKFPSVGSIVSREMGPRKNLPPYVLVPTPTEFDFFSYEEAYQAAFLGGEYDAMILPDPSKPDFSVPDLSFPKSISSEAIGDRRTLLSIVDRHHRRMEEIGEFAKMDAFQEQALRMLLSPHVRKAFDLSQESEKGEGTVRSPSSGAECPVGPPTRRGRLSVCYCCRLHARPMGYARRERREASRGTGSEAGPDAVGSARGP